MTEFVYTIDAVQKISELSRTMSAAAIADLLQTTTGRIEFICKRHGITVRARDFGELEPAPPPLQRKIVRKSMEIEIDEKMLGIVKRQARQRGLDTRTLIEKLIEKIAKDSLFSTILDR